jgi:hypothetical protein
VKGFSAIEIILAVVTLLALAGGALFWFKSDEKTTSLYAKQIGADQNCEGEGPVEFTHPPMKPEDVAIVLPYGLLAGGHVTPIDHMYFSPKNFNSAPDTYPVYAIADGTIGTISFRPQNVGEGGQRQQTSKKGDYRLDIYYNCTFFSYYDLITSLSPELAAQVPADTSQSWFKKVRIPIKTGQEIGRIGGQTLDWAVYNAEITLPGLLIPAHYEREPWKIHTDYQSLEYFVEPYKTQIYALLARQVEPRIGKLDYDIDGKLVGNWFVEGTNGYAGDGSVMQYWDGHLAVVPDYIDPTRWHFSIGSWNGGQATQFGIKGIPDPTIVGVETGPVKYELHFSEYVDGNTNQPWRSNEGPIANPKAQQTGPLQGTVILQLIEPRKLKVETFPGKAADQVTGFTSNAVVYER